MFPRRAAVLLAALLAMLLITGTSVGRAQTLPPKPERPEPKTTLPDVEDEVMCPVCGTLLELASEAPQAKDQRALIRRLIAEGRTKEEIKQVLVDEFGPEVLATPETKGFDLAAWLVPAAAILAAAVAIALGLRRWRRRSREGPDGPAAAQELDAEERSRLDRDLARYEL